MKIAFSGAQCTGKSTLMQSLIQYFPNYTFKANIVRDIAAKGIPINELGNEDTQMAIIQAHLDNLEIQNLVTDRCILDCVVYGEYLAENGKIRTNSIDSMLLGKHIDEYDYIFYLPPEIEIKDDGVRNTDKAFQASIHRIFMQYIAHLDNVVIVKGSLDERIQQVMDVIF